MTTENDTLRPEIRKEHFRAELQRLREGMEGCGCADCQELYKTLDLEKYGNRVKRYGDTVLIGDGKEKAAPDYWTKDGLTFVHYGQGWQTSKSGRRVCIGPVHPGDAVLTGLTDTRPGKLAVSMGGLKENNPAPRNETDNRPVCPVCHQHFTLARSDAVYCSSRCRVIAHRREQNKRKQGQML